jgi:hypothetical protein
MIGSRLKRTGLQTYCPYCHVTSETCTKSMKMRFGGFPAGGDSDSPKWPRQIGLVVGPGWRQNPTYPGYDRSREVMITPVGKPGK